MNIGSSVYTLSRKSDDTKGQKYLVLRLLQNPANRQSKGKLIVRVSHAKKLNKRKASAQAPANFSNASAWLGVQVLGGCMCDLVELSGGVSGSGGGWGERELELSLGGLWVLALLKKLKLHLIL